MQNLPSPRSHHRRLSLLAGAAALALLLGACATEPPGDQSAGPGTPSTVGHGTAEMEPGAYDQVMRIAEAARVNGELPSAVGLYRRANRIAPQRIEPLVRLGATLAEMRAYNEAAMAYREALKLQPKNVVALRGLANVLISLDQLPLALTNLDVAAKAAPQDPHVLSSLGVALDMSGKHSEAQAKYRAGLALAPNDPDLTNNLALSLALSGSYDAAIDLLRPLALSPASTPRMRQNLALLYGLAGDMDQAAKVGRVDLDEKSVQSNLAYYSILRQLADQTRSSAIAAATVQATPLPAPAAKN